jgi:Protein of unknown function (DUF4058)
MMSPFPGMDPYLEDREHWRGFHHYLADEIVKQLNPLIVPKYYADVEVHASMEEVSLGTLYASFPDAVVLEMHPERPLGAVAVAIPDAPIHRAVELAGQFKLRTVQVYETATKRVVTSIEILSPANKTGEGFQKYRQKRSRLLRSMIHLVELDFLRGGRRPGWEVADPPLDTDYVVLVNRAQEGDIRISSIWPVALNETLPTVPVPLLEGDPDVPLELSKAFATIYDSYYYALRIDYTQPVPAPELRPAVQQWLAEQDWQTR